MFSQTNEDTVRTAERICDKVRAKAFVISGTEFSVTLSVGIASRQKGEDINETIAKADEKMYEAKKNGRDRIVY